MSRFHNWVNHVMKPCAFVVELQADFITRPIRERLPLYPGYGPEWDDLDIFGGKVICALISEVSRHVLLDETVFVDFSADIRFGKLEIPTTDP